MALPWKMVQQSRNVFQINVPATETTAFRFHAVVLSDIHFDSPKCDRTLLKRHLKAAQENQAVVIINGDLFDCMGGKFDPRSSKGELRPEYLNGDYIDLIVEDAAQFFAPFASNICVVGDGNHETSVRNRLETDLIQRFVALLNLGRRGCAKTGGYSGFVKFSFYRKDGRGIDSKILAYHHGSGYSSEAAKRRFAHEHPDAHIVAFGHHHTFFSQNIARYRVSQIGQVYKDKQLILGVPSFKDDVADGYGGFAIEKGHSPKVLGSWQIEFAYSTENKNMIYRGIELTT